MPSVNQGGCMRTLLMAVLAGSIVTLPNPAGPATGPAAPAAIPSAAMASSSVPSPTSPFGWPLAGFPEVTRPFEPPEHPYGPGHRGVDLRGSPGQPVLAAGDGTVAFAGLVAGRPVVSVDHPNGLRTTYEPVAAAVTIGQQVHRGDVLGSLDAGHPGCAEAACLHWGVRRGEEYLDPLRLLAHGRVRLLPDGAQAAVRAGVSPASALRQPEAVSMSLPRNRRTARVCSRQTRDSVTPSTLPISASVSFSK
jgi:hypothetical protein